MSENVDERRQFTVAVVAHKGRHCFFWPHGEHLSGPGGRQAAEEMAWAQRRAGNAAHVFEVPPAARATEEKGANPWFDALT